MVGFFFWVGDETKQICLLLFVWLIFFVVFFVEESESHV